MAGDRVFAQMNELKVGKYVIVDDVACRVVSMDKSKPGKHGAAKMRVEAIGLFDNVRHSLMKSTDADVEVPIVIRKRAQVVSVSGTTAQLMDMASFEMFEVEVPEEMRPEVESGREIQYMEVMGAQLLLRVTGE